MLNAHSTFVVANSLASAPLLAIADYTSPLLTFDGNDAIKLAEWGFAWGDRIGVGGVDPIMLACKGAFTGAGRLKFFQFR